MAHSTRLQRTNVWFLAFNRNDGLTARFLSRSLCILHYDFHVVLGLLMVASARIQRFGIARERGDSLVGIVVLIHSNVLVAVVPV